MQSSVSGRQNRHASRQFHKQLPTIDMHADKQLPVASDKGTVAPNPVAQPADIATAEPQAITTEGDADGVVSWKN